MPDITSNLLAWWRLDDGAGATCADSSGNSRTGTLVGPPTWVTGKIGPYALSFDGSDYVDSSNFADNLTAFTVAAWFKASVNQVGTGGMIVSKLGAGGASTGTGWMLLLDGPTFTDGAIGVVIQQTGGTVYRGRVTTDTYIDSTWHHAVMVVTDFASLPSIYIDGVIAASTTLSAGTVTSISNANNVRVGNDYDSETFVGSIDEPRIYSRALTAADVSALYNFAFSSGVLMGQGAM